jgi:hypothetical protein
MGSGSAKAHESFAVAPALAGPGPTTSASSQLQGSAAAIAGSGSAASTPASAAALSPESIVETPVAGQLSSSEMAKLLDVQRSEEAEFLQAIGIEPPRDPEASPAPPLHVVPPTSATGHPDAEPLVPIPDAPAVGDPLGTPLLLAAGADLEDGTASLVAYSGPSGPREVLVGYVTPEAESKLLEALEVSGKTVAVQVEREVLDTLPQDVFFGAIEPAAKATNTWLKHGTGDPAAAAAALTEVDAAITARLAAPDLGDAERAMLLSYQSKVASYLAAAAGPGSTGSKLPKVEQHQGPVMKLVTEHVPAPATGEGLSTLQRPVSRITASIDEQGVASWDGTSRKAGTTGVEYQVDLGDGFTAVYRPHQGNDGASAAYSLRGALEITAPPGSGHGQELVHRLQQLHLVSDPMGRDEAEVAYLRANIAALGLEKHPAVKAAVAPRLDLEETAQLEILGERAHEVAGATDPKAAQRLSREIVLAAERRAAVWRIPELRDAVAAAIGKESGAALSSSPGYDPTPIQSGGWHTWRRLDVGADRAAVKKAFGKRKLFHALTGGMSPAELIRNGGVLASTERRALMGIRSGIGMSENADQTTGGARSVFLRVGGGSHSGDVFEWDDPTTLLQRCDWYAYPGDHFGALNPKSYNFSAAALTTDPLHVATFKGHTNEVMFRHGIDLLGSEAPSRIRCSNPKRREDTLAALAARGITQLHGKPIDEAVVC